MIKVFNTKYLHGFSFFGIEVGYQLEEEDWRRSEGALAG
jgi:hypothetical protein